MRPTWLLLILAACGDSSSEQTDAPSMPMDAHDECNALALPTSGLTDMQVASNPPAAQGGTITDGLYVATAVTTYTGAGGPTGPKGNPVAGVDMVSGSHFAYSSIDLVTQTKDVRAGTIATIGSALTATNTCPNSNATAYTFDASPTMFTLYQVQGATTLAITFTKS